MSNQSFQDLNQSNSSASTNRSTRSNVARGTAPPPLDVPHVAPSTRRPKFNRSENQELSTSLSQPETVRPSVIPIPPPPKVPATRTPSPPTPGFLASTFASFFRSNAVEPTASSDRSNEQQTDERNSDESVGNNDDNQDQKDDQSSHNSEKSEDLPDQPETSDSEQSEPENVPERVEPKNEPSSDGESTSDDESSSDDGNDPPEDPDPDNDPPPSSKDADKMANIQAYRDSFDAIEARTDAIKETISDHEQGLEFLSLIDVQLLLEDIRNLGKDFTILHADCFTVFKNVKADAEDPHTEREIELDNFNRIYQNHLKSRSKATEILKTLTPSNGSALQAPKISLPTFRGVHSEWNAFKSGFQALVYDSNQFSSSEKLRLLKQALSGPALDTLADLDVTDVNWPIGWNRVLIRWDSPRENAFAAVKPLLDLPPLMSQTSAGLHKLLAVVRTTRAQIAQINLGDVTGEEVLYIHFILTRLDSKTLREFSLSLNNNNVPPLKTLMDWVEKQAKSLDLTHEIKHNTPKSQAPKRDRAEQPILSVNKPKVQWPDKTTRMVRSPSPHPGRSSSHKQRKQVIEQSRSRSTSRTPHPSKSNQKPTPRSSSNSRARSQSPSHKKTEDFACYICNSSHHKPSQCPQFLGYSTEQRRDWVRSNHRCFNCLATTHSTKQCPSKYNCSTCKRRHHTMLHTDEVVSMIMTLASTNKSQGSRKPVTRIVRTTPAESTIGILPTCVIKITNATSNDPNHTARALIDSGAEKNFITQSAVQRLGLEVHGKGQTFIVAGGKHTSSIGETLICLQNHRYPGSIFHIYAYVLPKITCCLPGQSFDIKDWPHIQNLSLADPNFNETNPIDILLGTGFSDIIYRGSKISHEGLPSAWLTELGYVMQGSVRIDNNPLLTISAPVMPTVTEEAASAKTKDTLPAITPFDMEKFWKMEDLPNKSIITPMEKMCQDHFSKNVTRLADGRFQVRWPFIMKPTILGKSYKMALSRFYGIERKLQADPVLAKAYHDQINDYLINNELERILPSKLHETGYWIPHHCVLKPSSTSTKLRVVFDASAKTTSGVSMNAILAAGPTIQADLFSQLLNFRLKAVGLTADIQKMYRQIYVHPDERRYAQIIWRSDISKPLEHYRIKSIPFGYSASPFLSTRCLIQLAEDGAAQYPLAAKALQTSFYVDDFLFSVETSEDAIKFKEELLALLATAKMDLRKWSSNSPELLSTVPKELRETQLPLTIDDNSKVKTLGLTWDCSTDTFQFKVNLPEQSNCTKRSVLSHISKIFDPLGLVQPVIVTAKIMIQNLWSFKLDWDDSLPEPFEQQWITFAQELKQLEQIRIPRWIGYSEHHDVELHGFADASQKAYAGVVYLRTKIGDQFTCHLVASKSRVAPVKFTTIPRLELQAAVLMAELMDTIRQQYSIQPNQLHFWSDSTICLHWIYSHASKWKTFVAHRIEKIHDLSTPSSWNHVASEDNPADLSSRGLAPADLTKSQLWWNGPAWLQCEYTKSVFNPEACGEALLTQEHKKVIMAISEDNKTIDHYLVRCLSRISSYTKIVRVTALLINIARTKSFKIRGHFLQGSAYITDAELKVIQLIQAVSYEGLKEAVKNGFLHRRFKNYKNLRPLYPFFAKDNIWRVGGRLENSNLPFTMKHPALLPSNHPITKALILYTHQILAHGGRLTVLNHLRKKFWLQAGTKTIKSVIDKCLLCFRYQARGTTQLMGQLPAARTNATRPFLHCGTDLAGPYQLKNFIGRSSSKFKVWIVLFTCMATRAIHLEIVSSLSQFGFLLAFRRFIARRGTPAFMYSDNGTNFVGANHRMSDIRNHELTTKGLTQTLIPDLDLDAITWRFNPPSAPSMGGIWESIIRLIKNHLKKLILDDSLTWEQFETILIFVESIVNSRPITPLSDDPHDYQALCPSHFLINSIPSTLPEYDLTHLRMNRLDKYELVIRRNQELWKRWETDYVLSLQKRQKWQAEDANLMVDQMVIILDDQTSPLHWKLGRIKKVHPGSDDLTRVVTIETESSYKDDKGKLLKFCKEVTRPISKIARIPADEDEQNPKFKALPYPATHPAVTTVVKPQRMYPQPAWYWITSTIALAMVNIPTSSAISNTSSTENANRIPTIAQTHPVWFTNTIITMLTIFSILGILGNFCTILAIVNSPTLRKGHIHWFIVSLCCSDLVFSTTSLPLATIRLYDQRWPLPEIICHLATIFLYSNILCILSNLVAITINRYIKIVHHQWYHRIYSDKLVRYHILLTWTFSFGILMLPFFGLWGTIGRNPNKLTCTILPDEYGRSPKRILWTLGNIIPVTVIIGCYVHILIYVQRTRSFVRRLSDIAPNSGVTARPPTSSDTHLTRMVSFIVGGFLITFEPVLILNFFDPTHTYCSRAVHLAISVLAWSTTWTNLVIYVTTNREYRKAYSQLFLRTPRLPMESSTYHSTRTINILPLPPRTATVRPIRTRMIKIATWITILSSVMANHEPNPDIANKITPCASHWDTHYSIPNCVGKATWIHILENNTVCSNTQTCQDNNTVSSDGKRCIIPKSPCVAKRTLNLDKIQCQNAEDSTRVSQLKLPPLQSTLCSVHEVRLRTCSQTTEIYEDVPIAILGNQAYPLSVLRTSQHAKLDELNSYSCKGDCQLKQCDQGQCIGDIIFCEHFACTEQNSLRSKSPASECACNFNSSSLVHEITTQDGPLIPRCWGTMKALVHKSVHSEAPEEYPCEYCTIKCTTEGILITSPMKTPRYIRIFKNPGQLSVIPTTSSTTIHLTHKMLSATGVITVHLWFTNYDIPSIRRITCPTKSICEVVQCTFCVQRWINLSCYKIYHWIILLSIGCIFTAVTILTIYFMRTLRIISWMLTWPLRCVLWHARRKRKVRQHDAEINLPVMKQPRTSKGRQRNRYTFLPYVLALIATLNTLQACSDFQMMSASSNQCDYKQEGQQTCKFRLNTRLTISPVGQKSCLKLDDSHSKTVGTISVQTQHISLLCKKELLYYIPRASTKCDTSIQCFNIIKGASDCSYGTCANFNVNDTIEAFSHTKNNLGWAGCQESYPSCFWPQTGNCQFYRTSIINQSSRVFKVFTCSEWMYSVHLQIQFHIGNNVTTDTAILYPGKTTTINNVEFGIISTTIPPITTLQSCFITDVSSNRIAMTECNKRGEITQDRIGEIQCNSVHDAEIVNKNCFASPNLVKTQIDNNGIKCLSDLVDPERVFQENNLPIRLEDGVILSHNNSVEFDISGSAILEIQLNTEDFRISKEVENVHCNVQFISLKGCYSCIQGSTLLIHAQTERGSTTASIECPAIGFYSPIFVTSTPEVMQIIIKVDKPDIHEQCSIKCAQKVTPLTIKGHLQYLPDIDVRELKSLITKEPQMDLFGGFSFESLIGNSIQHWLHLGLMLIGIIIIAYVTLTFSLRIIAKKLV